MHSNNTKHVSYPAWVVNRAIWYVLQGLGGCHAEAVYIGTALCLATVDALKQHQAWIKNKAMWCTFCRGWEPCSAQAAHTA